jgi:hypothetical protein
MRYTHVFKLWKVFSCSALLAVGLGLPSTQVQAQVQTDEAPTGSSGLPEETLSNLVSQISDSLASKIQTASCPDMVKLLDEIKAASAKPMDPDSLITKALNDIKTNPKLKGVVIQKVSEPLLNRLLDCNMVPIDLLAPSS